jgi:DUF3047 family protein
MSAGLLLAIALLFPIEWSFESGPEGGLPPEWRSRGGSAGEIYRIESEPNGNRYLAARSHGSDVQLGMQVKAAPMQNRILSWRWRVWELPRNADERKLQTLDSAASIYAVFGSRLFPRILKYVWSSSVPAGTSLKHPGSDRVAIVVVASGERRLGQWQTVRRDIVEDYRAAFGTEPGNLIAIGIKTDSDSTAGSARADYDDLRLGNGL